MGDRINLNTAEALAPPTATWIEWKELHIDISSKIMQVKYVWHDDSGVIPVNGQITQTWTIRNIPDDPETPEDETNPEFDNLFGFAIRAQDVGTKIGRGLQLLIWSRMKDDILTPGNDGTFES